MPVEEEGEEGEEEKSFVEISQQLSTIAEKYNRDLEEVNKIFTQVSCNYGDLEQYLITNESQLLWNPLEDYALMNLDEESIEYQYLLSIKGQDKIDERKKFLQESQESGDHIEVQEHVEEEDGEEEPAEDDEEKYNVVE